MLSLCKRFARRCVLEASVVQGSLACVFLIPFHPPCLRDPFPGSLLLFSLLVLVAFIFYLFIYFLFFFPLLLLGLLLSFFFGLFISTGPLGFCVTGAIGGGAGARGWVAGCTGHSGLFRLGVCLWLQPLGP